MVTSLVKPASYSTLRPVSTGMDDRLDYSWYSVCNQVGQLSLVPLAGRLISTCQEVAAVLCDWEGNRRSDIGATRTLLYRLFTHNFYLPSQEIGKTAVKIG